MVALFSFMTSLALIVLGLCVVLATLATAGSKIVAALAGEWRSATLIPLPPRPRATVRVVSRDCRPGGFGAAWRAAA